MAFYSCLCGKWIDFVIFVFVYIVLLYMVLLKVKESNSGFILCEKVIVNVVIHNTRVPGALVLCKLLIIRLFSLMFESLRASSGYIYDDDIC